MEDRRWLWQRYCEIVWEAAGKGAARDLVAFRSICYKLWRPFVQPIVEGQFGTRDFSRLVVSKRSLFQNEDILSGIQLDAPKAQNNNDTGVRGMKLDQLGWVELTPSKQTSYRIFQNSYSVPPTWHRIIPRVKMLRIL
jgi:hypothetical protein